MSISNFNNPLRALPLAASLTAMAACAFEPTGVAPPLDALSPDTLTDAGIDSRNPAAGPAVLLPMAQGSYPSNAIFALLGGGEVPSRLSITAREFCWGPAVDVQAGSCANTTLVQDPINYTVLEPVTSGFNGAVRGRLIYDDGSTSELGAAVLFSIDGSRLLNYDFGEAFGPTALDSSGFSHNATLMNGPVRHMDAAGGYLTFNNSNAVLVDNSADLTEGSVGFTLSAKIRTTIEQESPIVSKWYSGPATSYVLRSRIVGGVMVAAVSVNGRAPDLVGTTQLNDGNWHLLTMTYDSANGLLRVYCDGALDGQTTVASPTPIVNSEESISIGRYYDEATPPVAQSTGWQGDVTNVRMTGRVLDPLNYVGKNEQCTQLAENGQVLPAGSPCLTE